MAERRMFAKTIIGSDAFLDMPTSARLLYYDLGMRADDDGFINSPRSIMRMTGSSDDDMKLLIAKKFVIPFENGIIVIKHWNINNYIQKDRYTETKYKEEKASLKLDENKAYQLHEPSENLPCIQPVSKMDTHTADTQVRLGKVSKGKVKEKNYSSSHMTMAEKLKSFILANNPGAKTPNDLSKWAADFERMERIDKRSPEQIEAVMEFSQKDGFWKSNILSAGKLREKFDTLLLQKDRPKGKPPSGPANKGNFEQRRYNDDDFNKLYKDV